MSAALRFAAFDVRTLAGTGRQAVVALLFSVAVAVVAPLPLLAVPAAAAMGSLSVSYPFATDERGSLDRLYALLPLERRDVVLGRYLTMLVTVVVLTAVAVVAAVAMSAVKGVDLDPSTLVAVTLGGVVSAAVALSVQLPVFFRHGFTRARPMAVVPVLAIALVVYGVFSLAGASDDVATAVDGRGGAVAASGAGVAVLLLAASAALSVRWYARRAL